jgi:hypothetical protein
VLLLARHTPPTAKNMRRNSPKNADWLKPKPFELSSNSNEDDNYSTY